MALFAKKKEKELSQEDIALKGKLLAQEIMPLQSIQGVFMRIEGGYSNIAIEIESTNDSLYTYEQKHDEAMDFAACFMALNWPASIIKVPKTIDANASLFACDSEIIKLREQIFNCTDPKKLRSLNIRLSLLSEKIRPEAETEALSGDHVIYPTYIVIQFPPNLSDQKALKDAEILIERFRDVGRHAHICQTAELIELLQLYFCPRIVDIDASFGKTPIMSRGA